MIIAISVAHSEYSGIIYSTRSAMRAAVMGTDEGDHDNDICSRPV